MITMNNRVSGSQRYKENDLSQNGRQQTVWGCLFGEDKWTDYFKERDDKENKQLPMMKKTDQVFYSSACGLDVGCKDPNGPFRSPRKQDRRSRPDVKKRGGEDKTLVSGCGLEVGCKSKRRKSSGRAHEREKDKDKRRRKKNRSVSPLSFICCLPQGGSTDQVGSGDKALRRKGEDRNLTKVEHTKKKSKKSKRHCRNEMTCGIACKWPCCCRKKPNVAEANAKSYNFNAESKAIMQDKKLSCDLLKQTDNSSYIDLLERKLQALAKKFDELEKAAATRSDRTDSAPFRLVRSESDPSVLCIKGPKDGSCVQHELTPDCIRITDNGGLTIHGANIDQCWSTQKSLLQRLIDCVFGNSCENGCSTNQNCSLCKCEDKVSQNDVVGQNQVTIRHCQMEWLECNGCPQWNDYILHNFIREKVLLKFIQGGQVSPYFFHEFYENILSGIKSL